MLGSPRADVKLADACKAFKKKFSCGAAVVETADNQEEIEIQGNVKDDILAVILKEYKSVPKEAIFYLEGSGAKVTKVPA